MLASLNLHPERSRKHVCFLENQRTRNILRCFVQKTGNELLSEKRNLPNIAVQKSYHYTSIKLLGCYPFPLRGHCSREIVWCPRKIYGIRVILVKPAFFNVTQNSVQRPSSFFSVISRTIFFFDISELPEKSELKSTIEKRLEVGIKTNSDSCTQPSQNSLI